MRGLRGVRLLLLVPTKILPPATTGPPNEVVPSSATHLMLLPVLMSHSSGSLRSSRSPRFRWGAPQAQVRALGVHHAEAVAAFGGLAAGGGDGAAELGQAVDLGLVAVAQDQILVVQMNARHLPLGGEDAEFMELDQVLHGFGNRV